MMPFPPLDPVALQIGSFAIRWYSLAYIAGIAGGWWLLKYLHKREPIGDLPAKAVDDMLVWAVAGVIGGGRLGYVLFYNPTYFLEYPEKIMRLWEGGMSFHGGLIGVLVAFWLFARKYKIQYLRLMDVIACVTPIGLFFGRLANFVNGELYGRVTDSSLGIVFPHMGPEPRHPSQLYEAALEGLLLFAVLFILARFTRIRTRPGTLGGIFLAGYAASRMFVELFREPDAQLGFLVAGTTMGQLLSLPMLLLGLALILRGMRMHVPARHA